MRTKVIGALALALLVLASCHANQVTRPLASGRAATPNNAEFTVIGTMQNRDRVVTVKSGPSGIVYSIATRDGKSLYENIPADKLKAEAPALHEFIQTGTAGYAGMGWTDARMKPTAPLNGRLDASR